MRSTGVPFQRSCSCSDLAVMSRQLVCASCPQACSGDFRTHAKLSNLCFVGRLSLSSQNQSINPHDTSRWTTPFWYSLPPLTPIFLGNLYVMKFLATIPGAVRLHKKPKPGQWFFKDRLQFIVVLNTWSLTKAWYPDVGSEERQTC